MLPLRGRFAPPITELVVPTGAACAASLPSPSAARGEHEPTARGHNSTRAALTKRGGWHWGALVSMLLLSLSLGAGAQAQPRINFATTVTNPLEKGSRDDRGSTFAPADFDGDGLTDLAITVGNGGFFDLSASVSSGGARSPIVGPNGGLIIALSNGDGTLAQTGYPVANANELVIADFNGDGALDVAVSSDSGSISVLINNGSGGFGAPVVTQTTGFPRNPVAGNFVAGGGLDLAFSFSNDQGNGIVVLPGQGDGTFGAAVVYSTGSFVADNAPGDFNGDGVDDLALALYNGNTARPTLGVFLNNNAGDGFAPVASYALSTNFGFASPVLTGDFNGDGALDLATQVSDFGGGSVTLNLLPNVADGSGTFGAPASYTSGNDVPITGDFNSDGFTDLASIDRDNGQIIVLLGTSDIGALSRVNSPVTDNASGLTVADFNGDDIPDLAAIDRSAGFVVALAGVGDGSFNGEATFGGGSFPFALAPDDFDGDGTSDLAALSSDAVSVLLAAQGTVTIDALTDLFFDQDSDPFPVELSGIGDGKDGTRNLSVSATSSNPNVATVTLDYTPSQSEGTLLVTPLSGGRTIVTVTVTEDGPNPTSKSVGFEVAVRETPSVVVTTLQDTDDDSDGLISLREAISFASNSGATVTFAPGLAGTIALQNSLFSFGPFSVQGPTDASIVVSGDSDGDGSGDVALLQVFSFGGGAINISNLTLARGAGFRGDLDRDSDGGPSISTFGATINFSNCTIRDNVGGNGGTGEAGNSNDPNSEGGNGGSGAPALDAFDGGTLTFNNCTLIGNVGGAGGAGGVGNAGNGAPGANANAINASSVSFCTITGNRGSTGRSAVGNTSGTTTISNSIVTGNTPSNIGPNVTATFSLTEGDGGLAASGLRDNGGPTQTIAIRRDGPAFNAGDPAVEGGTDQRGLARVAEGRADIGAYELQNNVPTDITLAPDTVLENQPVGTTVGSFTTIDADANDTFTYALVDDPNLGALDNALFRIVGGTLQTAAVLDFEADSSLTIRVQVSDGTETFEKILDVTVLDVNEAPTLSAIGAQATDEDTASAPITFTVSDPDGNLNDLTLAATSSDTALVPAAGIALGGSGAERTITLTPAADAFGTTTITVTVSDGALSSASSFVLTVNSVNDAPSFALGTDQNVGSNSGAQSVSGFATAISAGPANESGQTLLFTATNDNNALFSVQPAISADGTLSYTVAASATGIATVTVTLSDGGAVNSTAVRTFSITVADRVLGVGVSLTPAGPFTRDTLTATPVISDATGVTFNYEFFVNGASVQNGAANTLDLSRPGQGDKGDRISVTLTARRSDGALGSTTNGTTVRNSNPFAFSGTATAQSGIETLIRFAPFGNPGGGDSDGGPITFKSVGGPRNGSGGFITDAQGQIFFRYTARRGYVGIDVIRFVAVDDEDRTSNIATLGIDVRGVPLTNPTTQDASASTMAGVSVDVPVTGSDPGGGPVTFKRVGGPRNGVGEFVTLANGTTVLRYTSRANFSGVEEVRFVALDAGGRPSGVATIRITVAPSAPGALKAGNTPSAGSS